MKKGLRVFIKLLRVPLLFGRIGGPGYHIAKLSKDDREALNELSSEDIKRCTASQWWKNKRKGRFNKELRSNEG